MSTKESDRPREEEAAGKTIETEGRPGAQPAVETDKILKTIITAAPIGIGVVHDRVIMAANTRLCEMTGYSREELVGRNALFLYPTEEEYARVGREKYAQIEQTGIGSVETRLKRKDGTAFDVFLSSMVIDRRDLSKGVVFTVLDISERKALEEQLRQSQKMEAVGRLAGGLAHDFNNLLTGILGYSQLALDSLDERHPARGFVEIIRKTGLNASELIDRLLAFSRRKVFEPQVVDLNETIAGLRKMLERLIGEDMELQTNLSPGLYHIQGDPNQIAHAVINLAINSRDAMPHGGEIIIETRNVSINDDSVPEVVGIDPGDYATIEVRDTGVGMDEEVRSRALEPFFTTKEDSKGTGLGLSIVYGVVKQCGGNMWIQSEPGKGTGVKIYLPRSHKSPRAVKAPQASPKSLRGTETVLVAEDQELVRSLIARILAGNGYTVLQAVDGADALRVSREHDGPIHLLVTDVVMPRLSGADLAHQVQQERPETKVVYMSGHTSNSVVWHGVLHEGKPYMQKPFTGDDLARKVREVLDAPAD